MGMGYTLPEYKSVHCETIEWHAAKLAEECGEVCQKVCKHGSVIEIAEECIDAIQCAENIMRSIGITDGMVDNLRDNHIDKDGARGYIVDSMELF